jgi:hypothetical protein
VDRQPRFGLLIRGLVATIFPVTDMPIETGALAGFGTG